MLVRECLVGLHKPFNFSFLGITSRGIDLDYCNIDWFALEMNRDHSIRKQKTNQTDNMDHSLVYSMKLWAMQCRAPQEGWVMVESSDETRSTREGNSKPLNYSCFENPMSSMKRQKSMTLKDELPRSVGDHHAIGEQWRNNSRKKKRRSQSKNSAQLWMWLVMEVKSAAVKEILHRNLKC